MAVAPPQAAGRVGSLFGAGHDRTPGDLRLSTVCPAASLGRRFKQRGVGQSPLAGRVL